MEKPAVVPFLEMARFSSFRVPTGRVTETAVAVDGTRSPNVRGCQQHVILGWPYDTWLNAIGRVVSIEPKGGASHETEGPHDSDFKV